MAAPIPTILAFGFASPWLLWGLVLAGIPIVVHLLHKRRYRQTQWAAMRFLMEAARKHARRIRLEQLLLLLIRTLILLLLVLAMAQPFVESLGGQLPADQPTHTILVVDASFSLGFQQNDSSRFSQAKETAREIASAAQPGDALNLVRIAGKSPHAIIRQPAFEKSQVIQEIDQLSLTDQRGDVLATLQTVEELLRQLPEIKRKEVYLVSDFQRDNWSPESSGRAVQIRRSLKRLSESSQLVLVGLDQQQMQNAAVTSFTADKPFVAIDQRARFTALVKNFGRDTLTSQTVELFVDGQLAESRRIDLPPGTEVPVEFTYEFRSPGDHGLEVRLQDDWLPLDNRRWLSLPVKGELRVLLVNGKYSGRLEETATYYLRNALSPSVLDKHGKNLIQPHVIDEGELTGVDLDRYDCVFLSNVGLFTRSEVDILRTYVESGGGLVFCLGDQVQAENYNLLLYEGGRGILPARLGNRMGNAQEPVDVFRFDVDKLDHPIVSVFQGNPGTGLETTLTLEYFQTTIAESSQARPVLRFNTGDPAIIDMPVGRGRSILVTTAVDNRWSTWAVNASFLPVMHEAVHFATAGRWGDRRLLVGDALTRVFSTPGLNVPASVTLPGGDEQTLRPIVDDQFYSIHFDATDRSGLYDLSLGTPMNHSELFAVNVDSRESDLRALDEQQLKNELLPGVQYSYRTGWHNIQRANHVTVTQPGGLARWLLLATFCLLLVEQSMAWDFFYGFLFLYLVVAFGFVRHAMLWNPLSGSILLLVFLLGLAAILHFRRREPTRSQPPSFPVR